MSIDPPLVVHVDHPETAILPKGKTCSDCAHLCYCRKTFDCEPTNKVCDWVPSAFVQSRVPATQMITRRQP